jgi:L-rhamnose-H+ transport protein
MDLNPFIGIALYALGGLSGACFYLPFKGVRQWAWESYWMIYALSGLVLVPWALAFAVSPNVIAVLRQTSWQTLWRCYVFGAMWGVGGLSWGLMIRYLGVGLGLAIGCGVCASVGTLIPPLVSRELAGYAAVDWGLAVLAGVGIAVLGIVVSGAAGISKERELSAEQKKESVAEFDFRKGVPLAFFSGIMSAGMGFGLHAGAEIERTALDTQPATLQPWQGIPVLVVVLLGGFTVNFLWCLYLNLENRSVGDYIRSGAPLAANALLAAAAGAIWCSQFALFKVADAKSGPDIQFAGWTVLMSSMIIFSTLLGILLREWRGVSGRTKALVAAGLLLLITSLASIGYGNYLKNAVRPSAPVRVGAATRRRARPEWSPCIPAARGESRCGGRRRRPARADRSACPAPPRSS